MVEFAMQQLKSLGKKLYLICFFSFVLRVIGYCLLPSKPSILGPDEGTYGRVAEWTALGRPAAEFPDFGESLYISARAIIWPAAIFNKMGVDPLNSVRLVSTIYGILTLCVLTYIFLKAVEKNRTIEEFVSSRPSLILVIFFTFAFLPSHFVWSLLGLRESSTEFWTVVAFATIYWIFHLSKGFSPLPVITLVASVIFTFSSRPQVGWVLGITIILALVLRIRNKIAVLLIPITLVSMGIGHFTTTPISIQMRYQFEATKMSADKPRADQLKTKDEKSVSKLCTQDKQIIGFQNSKYLCTLKSANKSYVIVKSPGENLVKLTESIPYHQTLNQADAASVITTISCPVTSESRLDNYFCMAWRAPYSAATFLFRPLIIIDVTSTLSLLAAIENIWWLGTFIYIFVMAIKKRRFPFLGAFAPLSIFLMLYSVGAGLYEGNMGTAFRHKSLILWVVLLFVASVIAAGKRPITGNEPREKGV
jgi:hypothetical protein